MWLFSSRLMSETILNRLGADCKPEPQADAAAPKPPEAGLTDPPVEDKSEVPVIGMNGKTKDGAMPYEILKDKLEWLK